MTQMLQRVRGKLSPVGGSKPSKLGQAYFQTIDLGEWSFHHTSKNLIIKLSLLQLLNLLEIFHYF